MLEAKREVRNGFDRLQLVVGEPQAAVQSLHLCTRGSGTAIAFLLPKRYEVYRQA